jgi:glycosyltransferase involved in cell wall biosynthesis
MRKIKRDSAKTPNICLITPFNHAFPISGGEARASQIMNQLLRFGRLSCVWTSNRNCTFRYKQKGVNWLGVPAGNLSDRTFDNIVSPNYSKSSKTPVIAELIDLLVISGFFSLHDLPSFANIPTIIDFHDLPIERQFEELIEKINRNLDIVLLTCTNSNDFNILKALTEKEVLIIPNGGKIQNQLTPKSVKVKENLAAIFVGSSNSHNQKAVENILFIASKCPNIDFHIVGRISRAFRNVWKQNVVFHGYLPDKGLYNLYSSVDFFINPMNTGFGTSIKIIEANNFFIPILSSSIGVRNLELIPNEDFIQLNSNQEFINFLNRDPQLVVEALNGLALNRKTSVWETNMISLNEFLVRHFHLCNPLEIQKRQKFKSNLAGFVYKCFQRVLLKLDLK